GLGPAAAAILDCGRVVGPVADAQSLTNSECRKLTRSPAPKSPPRVLHYNKTSETGGQCDRQVRASNDAQQGDMSRDQQQDCQDRDPHMNARVESLHFYGRRLPRTYRRLLMPTMSLSTQCSPTLSSSDTISDESTWP